MIDWRLDCHLGCRRERSAVGDVGVVEERRLGNLATPIEDEVEWVGMENSIAAGRVLAFGRPPDCYKQQVACDELLWELRPWLLGIATWTQQLFEEEADDSGSAQSAELVHMD